LGFLQLSTPGHEFLYHILLQALKESLDLQTQRVLMKKKEDDPTITYAQFWALMEKEFEVMLPTTIGQG